MSKVLVVATSPRTRGGVTAVVNAHRRGPQWKDYHCRWISSHIDRGSAAKLVTLAWGLLEFIFWLPWADLVHIHVNEHNSARRKLCFFRLAKLFRKKVIMHFHAFSPETTVNSCYEQRYRELFCGSDAVVVLSNWWKEVVDAKFHLGDRIRVIYNPCPKPVKVAPAEKTCSILYAGMLTPRKGYADLLRAFASIAPAHPEWHLTLAGNGETAEAEKLAAELGIAGQVSVPGWISGERKDEVFRQASIFCLPSYAEGFPMAVLDALAYGLPVITTPVGGIPDVAEDGRNMLLFQPGDTAGLAACLERLMADEALRSELAGQSVRLAATTFDIDTINSQLGALYRELLGD